MEKCVRHFEKQNLEILKLKTLLNNLRRSGNDEPSPDFSVIPKLPLSDENALQELESWLNIDANYMILVSI
jgi:hypothetical protein